MSYVRSIYSLFSLPICTEIVVAVLLLFFSSSPSCFLFNAKFLQGSWVALVVSLRILPLIWCAFVSGLHCNQTDVFPSPFRWTESHCETVRTGVSCAEKRRVHLKTAGTTTRSPADGLTGLAAAVTQVFQKVPSTSSTKPSLSPALLDTRFPPRCCLPKQET